MWCSYAYRSDRLRQAYRSRPTSGVWSAFELMCRLVPLCGREYPLTHLRRCSGPPGLRCVQSRSPLSRGFVEVKQGHGAIDTYRLKFSLTQESLMEIFLEWNGTGEVQTKPCVVCKGRGKCPNVAKQFIRTSLTPCRRSSRDLLASSPEPLLEGADTIEAVPPVLHLGSNAADSVRTGTE